MRLLAKAPGMLHHTIRIAVFGSSQPPLVSGSACVGVQVVCRSEYRHGAYSLILLLFQEVALSCIGHGPLVHIQTTQLHFGKIPVLTDIGKTLLLSNHSPIPAHFTTPMVQTLTQENKNTICDLDRQAHTIYFISVQP